MAMAVVYTNFCGMLVHENRGGTERDYMPDPLGSSAALMNNAQTQTDTWEYWPYGEVSARTGATVTPFTFVGLLGYFDDLMDKLYYVRARFLQPNFGTWLTVDPLWPQESAFSYAHGNPIVKTDPSGGAVGTVELGDCMAQVQSQASAACDLIYKGNRTIQSCIFRCIFQYFRDWRTAFGKMKCLREWCQNKASNGSYNLTILLPWSAECCRYGSCGSTVRFTGGKKCNPGICLQSCVKGNPCNATVKWTVIHEMLHCCENIGNPLDETTTDAVARCISYCDVQR